MNNSNTLPEVSVVVIGRNESRNLPDTFKAIMQMDYPREKIELIFVDNNSTDNSVEIAKTFTDKVFVERADWPVSGLARNRGLLEASHEIIHFIDGDISITKDYLRRAVEKIQRPDVDAVTGYFREKYPEKFFNRILDIRRDDIVHEERYCESTNGGGTYLKSKLRAVNGYDERILKGQESELGMRFRNNGNKILFIDVVQGYHNFDVNSIWDFYHFSFAYGRSNGYLLKLTEDSNAYIQNCKNSAIKTLVINSFTGAIVLFAVLSGWFVIAPLYYLFRLLMIFVKTTVIQKKSWRQLLYNFIQYTFRFANYFGTISILLKPTLKPGPKMKLQ